MGPFRSILHTVLLAALACLAAVPAPAAQGTVPKVLRSASELDYPPFALALPDGTADGFSVELLRAVAEKAGLKIRFKTAPWAEIKQELADGRLDVLPLVSYSRERDVYFDFSIPYLQMHGSIFVREGTKGIENEGDLKDKTVLVMRGDTAQEYAERNHLAGKLVLTESYGEAMTLLSEGRYDAVLVQQVVGWQIIKKLGLKNIEDVRARPLDPTLRPEGHDMTGFVQKFCLAVPEGNHALLARLNEGLSAVFADGTYDRLYLKWFGPILPRPEPSFTQVAGQALVFVLPAALLMALGGLVFLKIQVNRKTAHLREEVEQRKRAEAQVARSREWMHSLLDHLPLSVYLQTGKHEITFANEHFRCGHDKDTGRPCHEVLYGSPAPCVTCRAKQVLQSGEALTWEKLEPDGRTLLVHNVPFRDMDGSPVVLAAAMDITETKRIEEALNESENLYRTLINNMPDIVMRYDRQLRRRFVSENIEQYSGFPPAYFIGKTNRELGMPEDLSRFMDEHIAKVFETGEPIGTEFHVDWNGRSFRFDWRLFPERDADGKVQTVSSIHRDITRQHLMEAEYQLLFNGMLDGFASHEIICDEAGNPVDYRFLRVNPAFERLTGVKAAEILGRTMREVFPRIESYWIETYGKVALTGEPVIFEHYAADMDKYFNVSAFCPAPGRFATIFSDVTERVNTAKALVEAKELAESASRVKSEFLANMSHEIRTPLNGIMGMLQLLRTGDLTDEQAEYAAYGIEASRRLTRLLTDILDLSRIEAGKLDIREEPLNLRDMLTGLEQMFTVAARSKGLNLDFSVPDGLPGLLFGDDTRLQQVLVNLVGNAIKYTEAGLVGVNVTVLPRRRPGTVHVLFTVTDTGIGIPDDKMGSIFEHFTQVSSGFTRHYQGAGLGLAISKRMVGLLGGTMAVDSTPGLGTTFCLCVPLRPTEDDGAESTARTAEPRGASPSLNILLAEDDRVNSLAVSGLLKRMGHRVRTVDNGEMALTALRDETFDLVLMDIQMPVMDGVQATRAIRKGEVGPDKTSIPIIAMTAYAMKGDRENFLGKGMTDYIAKPLDKADLESAIRRTVM
ncbi:Autoinducer 2 sensor kinase/phosphatase LuxQ [Pseudodesulfovibrio hydrargyri]|uniref:histidine kinase n=1 Tax=Pseudodesulfovibrio hydrargyri TaxID=2125990 RepID=A0A1J5N7P8_9BACT|nr:transporter substrate-binding domain-containing protein [Pseudodesulfovibrio hydrargyri]OIQ50832.1 Autoinducer 2 sensor kinase/phosphatase LuxQ [Pseudodesulfovibrio hydrargyri]